MSCSIDLVDTVNSLWQKSIFLEISDEQNMYFFGFPGLTNNQWFKFDQT